jgi:hypothetical protein
MVSTQADIEAREKFLEDVWSLDLSEYEDENVSPVSPPSPPSPPSPLSEQKPCSGLDDQVFEIKVDEVLPPSTRNDPQSSASYKG